jgi:tetratricopeptide (TPR) repeat protein
LEIDETLGEAYAVLAFTVLFYDWNWPEAERLVRQALELNPNLAFAYECYSNLLTTQGKFDDAVAEIKCAEELDPMSPRAMLMTSWTLYQARQFTEAIASARKAAAMQDDFAQANIHLGNALTEVGELDEAVKVLRMAAEIWGKSGMPRYMLAFARARRAIVRRSKRF